MTDLRQGVSQSTHDVLDLVDAMGREKPNANHHLARANARLGVDASRASRLDIVFAAAHLLRALEIDARDGGPA